MDGDATPIPLEMGAFHPERNQIVGPRGTIPLSPMESRLLAFLADRPGHAFTQGELLRRVWGYRESVNSRTVYSTIGRLRARIERDPTRPRHLKSVKSVRGAGYCFEPLETAVLSGGVASAPPSADEDSRTAFVGRQAELAQLLARLGEGARLISLVGAGGMGKTRLAQRFIALYGHGFAGGACFVELADCWSAEQLARAVALALGADPVGTDAQAQAGSLLARRGRALLVLDNVEQLGAEARAPIQAWRARAPEAVLLVTSRRQLGLEGEEGVLPIGPLQEADAAALFRLRARARGRPLSDEGTAHAEVLALARALDANPLALELAAARISILSPAGILARLEQRLRLLSDVQGQPTRHASLRMVIDWSWTLLQPWEQATLAQLSCFVGGFSLPAAEAVVDLAPWPEAPWALDGVQSLVEHSLVRASYDPSAGQEPRFSLYRSVQDYAAARLRGTLVDGGSAGPAWAGPEAEQAAFARHGQYHASLDTPSLRQAWGSYSDPALLRRMAVDLDNYRAAVERAIQRADGAVAAHCARLAASVYRREGPFSQGVALLRPLLDIATGDHLVDIRVALAECLCDEGQFEAAVRESTAARTEARARGLDHAELSAHLNLMNAHLHGSGPSLAEEEGRRLLTRCHALGGLEHGGDALIMLASAVQLQGRKEEALRLYEEAISMFMKVGNLRGIAMASGNMGNIHRDAGRLDAAERAYQEAARLHLLGQNRRRLAVVHSNLAGLHELRGEPEVALALYTEALKTHHAIGNLRSEIISCGCLAQLLMALGRLPEARAALNRGLALLQQSRGLRIEVGLLSLEAACLLEEGDTRRAVRVATDTVALARQGPVPEAIATGLGCQGLGLARLGEEAAARAAWAEGAALLDQIDTLTDRVWFEASEVEGWMALGDVSTATARLTTLEARIAHLPRGSSLRHRVARAAAAVMAGRRTRG